METNVIHYITRLLFLITKPMPIPNTLNLNLLTWDNLIKYSDACMAYEILHRFAPPPLNALIKQKKTDARGVCLMSCCPTFVLCYVCSIAVSVLMYVWCGVALKCFICSSEMHKIASRWNILVYVLCIAIVAFFYMYPPKCTVLWLCLNVPCVCCSVIHLHRVQSWWVNWDIIEILWVCTGFVTLNWINQSINQ